MKENYTHITMILDRSGSMAMVKEDTIGSFNEFIREQKEVDGECTFTLVQFDTDCDVVHNFLDIKEVPDLNGDTYVPRSKTALLDAIGKTIHDIGEKLSNMKEEERPERVLTVILTDGMENSSKEFISKTTINEMITRQTNEYNWQFIFLDAFTDDDKQKQDISYKKENK